MKPGFYLSTIRFSEDAFKKAQAVISIGEIDCIAIYIYGAAKNLRQEAAALVRTQITHSLRWNFWTLVFCSMLFTVSYIGGF
jgi:hypothetical protein